jgi:hypothetical protein
MYAYVHKGLEQPHAANGALLEHQNWNPRESSMRIKSSIEQHWRSSCWPWSEFILACGDLGRRYNPDRLLSAH